MDYIHNSKVLIIIIQTKLKKTKNSENLVPIKKKKKKKPKKHRSATEKTRSTPPQPKMVEKLHHSPRKSLTRAYLRRKKLLIKTNKTRNTTIKNSSDRSEGDDRY